MVTSKGNNLMIYSNERVLQYIEMLIDDYKDEIKEELQYADNVFSIENIELYVKEIKDLVQLRVELQSNQELSKNSKTTLNNVVELIMEEDL
jgi:hypothetical protein